MAKAGTYKTYSVILGMKYDAEIIGKLESVKSRGSYIKSLIEADISGETDNSEKTDITPNEAEELITKYTDIIKEKYGEKYLNNTEKTVTFHCNYDKCSEIISKLDSVENKSEYVKNLILADMGLIGKNGERYMADGVGEAEPRTKDRKMSKYVRNDLTEEEKEKRRAAHREAQKRYMEKGGKVKRKEYNEKIKSITLDISLDFFEEIENHVLKTKEPRNTFIKRAIIETIKRDNNS